MQPWTLMIAGHAVVATLALALGAYNVLRRTRGDRPHRAVGRAWSVLMLVTALGSFGIGGYDTGLSWFLHGLAAWTVISVSLGWYFARRHRRTQSVSDYWTHAGFMIGTYLGLIGALIGVVAVPTRRVPSYFAAYPWTMTAITVGLFAAAAVFVTLVRRTARAAA